MANTRDLKRPTARARTARKDHVIQVRTTAVTKSILNRAAALKGQKLSEFVLESARKDAEETILDQRVFFLSPEDHDEFLRLLDKPSKPSDALRARMNRRPLWEE